MPAFPPSGMPPGPRDVASLADLAKSSRDLAAAQRALAQQARALGLTLAKGAKPGPAQQLVQARGLAALPAAQQSPALAAHLQQQAQQAQARLDQQAARARAQTPAGRFSSLLASTRLNLGVASPLVGRVSKAVESVAPGAGGPVLGALGAVALAVQAVVAVFNVLKGALETFLSAVKMAADALADMHAAALQSGDRTGATSFLTSLGLSPGQIPGLARGAREAASSSPAGMFAAQQLGLGMVPGRTLAPGLNEAEFLKRVVKSLADIQNPAQRFAQAVRLDQEALLPAVDFYDRHRAAVDADAKAMDAIADKATQQAGADLVSQLERVKKGFLEVVIALAKPFLKPLADMVGRFADELRNLALWINNNQDSLKVLGDELRTVANAVLEFTKGIAFMTVLFARFMNNLTGTQAYNPLEALGQAAFQGASALERVLNGAGVQQQKAANTQQQAADDMAAWIKMGMSGGGPRARGAFPSDLRGVAFQYAAEGQAIKTGAFVL